MCWLSKLRHHQWIWQTKLMHPFNGPLSVTIRTSRYQKGKTNLDFTETRDGEWQWQMSKVSFVQ